MTETYQGCNAQMFPVEYARRLRQWCDQHGVLLIFDEIQAAFGRTGTMFGFEHLGVSPDLITCGKGISGGMPLSAVVGRREVMDLYGPGQMTSTHTANPVCCAATLANLQAIEDEDAVGNAARLGSILAEACEAMRDRVEGADRPRRLGRPGRRASVRDPGHDDARPRYGLGSRAEVRGIRRDAVRPGGRRRRRDQDQSAADHHRRGVSRGARGRFGGRKAFCEG